MPLCLRLFLFSITVCGCKGFTICGSSRTFCSPRKSRLLTRRAGYATTREGKLRTILRVRKRLKFTKMVVVFEGSDFGPDIRSDLLDTMPNTTKIIMVKNKLFKIGASSTPFSVIEPLLKFQNSFVFIHDDIPKTLRAFKRFSIQQEYFGKHNVIKGGVMDGELLTPEQIDYVATLPPKKTIMAKIAKSIEAVPLRLVRSIKAVPSRLARSVQLAKTDPDKLL